ncbi:hypothetical protein VTJ49DRAFT_1288 [Mycothermus thermophilus]|uniref:Protein kinase domain-containing protein n=1 Tax=Humicola insolens TaxID=85995 RepID=A0ABR3VDN2_HUMIN
MLLTILARPRPQVPPWATPEIPNPYQPAASLSLQVIRRTSDLDPPLPDSITAVIYQVLGMTMSPVLRVLLLPHPAGACPPIPAVLKLYDRRFGTCQRDVGYVHRPLTEEDEEAFWDFVRSGRMELLLEELDKQERETRYWPKPWQMSDDSDDEDEDENEDEEVEEEEDDGDHSKHKIDGDNAKYDDDSHHDKRNDHGDHKEQDKLGNDSKGGNPDDSGANDKPLQESPEQRETRKRAQYEASLWRACDVDFRIEIKAYDRLRDLQGQCIPRLLAHVRVDLRKLAKDLADSQGFAIPDDLIDSPYCEIRGVLMEYIPGCSLYELRASSSLPATAPRPPEDAESWTSLVQRACDVVYEINKHGIILNDCQPRNLVVRRHDYKPFMVDLARCTFKEELELDDSDDEDDDIGEGINNKHGNDDDGEGHDEKGKPLDEEEARRAREAKFWDVLWTWRNTEEIGNIMKMQLKREKGIELKPLRHPDYAKIIQDIKDGVEVCWHERIQER